MIIIADYSHSEEWIQKKRSAFNNADPILVEKVIKAFTLLEVLSEQKVDFIFKGGTSLLLLLPKPFRLSIDIDIIIEEKPDDLEQVFGRIIDNAFTGYIKQLRHV